MEVLVPELCDVCNRPLDADGDCGGCGQPPDECLCCEPVGDADAPCLTPRRCYLGIHCRNCRARWAGAVPKCPTCGALVETRTIVRVQHKVKSGMCGWVDCRATPHGKLDAALGAEEPGTE